MSDPVRFIRVRGARTHNLKNVDVDIPKNSLVVITGLSGSGKSSLAFDTIYAEGQRRYVESLSSYARQFLDMMDKPDVDSIDGLAPAVAIEQKSTSKNPRSTVATVTEIYDYMRVLWARAGVPHSPATGLPIEAQTVSEMVDRVIALPEGARVQITAPVVRGRKGEFRKELDSWLRAGFQRVRVDGEVYPLDEAPTLSKRQAHDIDVVVDRLVVRPSDTQRIAESLETALRLADGLANAERVDPPGDTLAFSERYSCPVSGFTLQEVEPRLFSFNSPQGACPTCDGLGLEQAFDVDLVVPDRSVSLRKGAIAPWSKSTSPFYTQTLEALARHFSFTLETAWRDLPPAARDAILHGTGKDEIAFRYDDGVRRYDSSKPFEGVLPNLARRWAESESTWVRDELTRYRSSVPCPACGGKRLKPAALSVKICGLDIAQAAALSISEARRWFGGVEGGLKPAKQQIAKGLLREICARLTFLDDVGLSYLTLDRAAGTLSGGESQRIRLASQIGSGLTGVLYVLDEPSIGLHQRDNAKLLDTLQTLRDLGNSVLVVEHDEDTILAADFVIDMGPAAGVHGGTVIAQGKPADLKAHPESLTGAYLSGRRVISAPSGRRAVDLSRCLEVRGATGNNLRGVDARFPLGAFVCVTGVSGGGKSTLTIETLYKAAARRLHGASDAPGPHLEILGLEHIDKVIDIDQSPIGRTPRSNPATYTGAFTPIRDWFSGLPESKARGYRPGRFSFNVKGGRCEACQGDGVVKVEMHFLADVYVTCDTCRGRRYNRETLEVLYRGLSIADVLDLTVAEGARLFEPAPAIGDKLRTLEEVGLGYLKIGQQATTLSGGEAQRIKLSKELARRATGRTLYVLDEPTTGLHFEDVRRLLEVLHRLVDQGNTVIVIEHNLDVVKTADWILDLGPEGGTGGGRLVVEGPPDVVAATPESWTGRYLAPLLAGSRAAA